MNRLDFHKQKYKSLRPVLCSLMVPTIYLPKLVARVPESGPDESFVEGNRAALISLIQFPNIIKSPPIPSSQVAV